MITLLTQLSATAILFGSLLTMHTVETDDLAQKQRALHESVSWIPNNQQIDRSELPKDCLRLDWMKRISSDLPVSMVSIPATHDAGTALGNFGSTRCQILNIPAQLAVGVRGFDIRLRLVGSDLGVYHSEESQKLKFDAVMGAFKSFLHDHPSELIIMRVREEAKAIRPNGTFADAFLHHIAPYKNLFYVAASRTEIPNVGQLRGKILILDNYGKLPNAVDYPNSSMRVQDDYDTDDMDKKYQEIVASFDAATQRKDGSIWDVNYTSSCTLKVDQLANAKAVNDKVRTYLKGKHGPLGLVLFNFPSVDVIDSVIQSNF